MRRELTISISGLHCTACELLNENGLGELPGVIKVDVDRQSGQAKILYTGKQPNSEEIQKVLKKNGYNLAGVISDRDITDTAISELRYAKQSSKTNWQLIIPALLLAYWLVGRFNFWDASALIQGEFSLSVALLVGLVAGASTCLALVGGLVFGIATNYAKNNPDATKIQKIKPHLLFNAGRIIGFFILGGILALIGTTMTISPIINGLLAIMSGVIILFLGLKLLDIVPALNNFDIALPKNWGRKIRSESPLVLGALSFFLPCGFTQAMQIYALSSGNFLNGGLIMSLFALGTTPGLLGIGGLSLLLNNKRSQIFFKTAGILVIIFALFNINNGTKLLKTINFPVKNTFNKQFSSSDTTLPTDQDNGNIQIIRMTESSRGYTPNIFTIKKGQPVRWIIDAQAPYSCASSLIVPALNISRQLKRGENIIEFTPTATGNIPFSCSMGMYNGNFQITN